MREPITGIVPRGTAEEDNDEREERARGEIESLQRPLHEVNDLAHEPVRPMFDECSVESEDRVARLFVHGKSVWEIVFFRPGERAE